MPYCGRLGIKVQTGAIENTNVLFNANTSKAHTARRTQALPVLTSNGMTLSARTDDFNVDGNLTKLWRTTNTTPPPSCSTPRDTGANSRLKPLRYWQ